MRFPEWHRSAVRKVSRILVLLLFVAVGAPAQADQGPRHHAERTFDAATSTYTVVKGDDLDAIAERFGVTLEELMKVNQLSSTQIEVGQPLVIAAAVQTTGKPGSPSATTTLPGNQLPAPAPKFGGVI
jgi:hypothetical protein